ncbi:hypothetical protein ACWGS5_26725 [Streptomyces albidoflavus]|uniref:hypothetical protein n=2 Tax=Streptomyces TaxID=1883 RepID=UPI0004C5FB12|nr:MULTISPECIES: hypothetical protein [Streptomyces]MCG5122427.1 hypothetical protein [Streptomyces sp. T7(2022)]MCK2144243.1 hypothetical protein [Streptomyces sp. WAC00276]MCR0990230.1 hypothetical protein [Streptomyces albidoflavus]MDH6192111.1 hypothetical protein [Streptomyces sp. CZ24]QDD61326.1 hypothetical protein FE156_25190 [Streptomyces albidoflavus]
MYASPSPPRPAARRPRAAAAALALLLPLLSAVPAHAADEDPPPRPFGAHCRVITEDSEVTGVCHNPYPEPDQVRLHLRCAAWWDLDTDGPAREVGPAGTVKLTGRCWQAVDAAWVSHAR